MPVRKLRLGSYLYDECFRAEADQVLATLGLDRLVESRGGGDQSVSVSRERVLEPADKRGEERRFHGRDQGPDGLRPAGCECSSGVVRGVVEARGLGQDALSGGFADLAASVAHPRHGGVRHPSRLGYDSNGRGHWNALGPRTSVSLVKY